MLDAYLYKYSLNLFWLICIQDVDELHIKIIIFRYINNYKQRHQVFLLLRRILFKKCVYLES